MPGCNHAFSNTITMARPKRMLVCQMPILIPELWTQIGAGMQAL